MQARVIAKTTIHNEPVKIGEIVEVDETTFRNLQRKGRLEKADKPEKAKGKGAKNAEAEASGEAGEGSQEAAKA